MWVGKGITNHIGPSFVTIFSSICNKNQLIEIYLYMIIFISFHAFRTIISVVRFYCNGVV